jgi:uncharacterized membrane protein YkvA (DUF1232 family)
VAKGVRVNWGKRVAGALRRRKGISVEEARNAVRSGAKRIKDADLKSVLEKEGKIRELASQGPLSKLFQEIQLLLALIRAYWKGEYREVPWYTIAAIVSSLLYVLSPVDLIPDVLPLVGYVDDAAVIAACLAMVREDLARFKARQG